MNTTVIVNVGTLTAEASALIDRIMNRPAPSAEPSAPLAPALPSPATAQAGERYAGIAFENGEPSHHLFLLDIKPASGLTWKAAKDWAAGIGATLPTRFESALLYANLRDQFDASNWHWTDTQYSDDYAFFQDFSTGNQGLNDKGNALLARAVRRLPL